LRALLGGFLAGPGLGLVAPDAGDVVCVVDIPRLVAQEVAGTNGLVTAWPWGVGLRWDGTGMGLRLTEAWRGDGFGDDAKRPMSPRSQVGEANFETSTTILLLL
jgi:hypothetical protein